MKRINLSVLIFFFSLNFAVSQEWMTSLDIAKKLALAQNKMLFMMWEEATIAPFPVFVNDKSGKTILVEDLFESELLNQLIWQNFIPVAVGEWQYEDLYKEIKGKRSQNYIDKFNDDTIKIMDINGNILNTPLIFNDNFNLTKFINKYALDTAFINAELVNYSKDKNFYTAFYLGSKYIDYAVFAKSKVRPEIIGLANLYLKEAEVYLDSINIENKAELQQHFDLTRLKQYLVLNRPKKVLRQLKRIDKSQIADKNKALVAFMYLTAYRLLKDEKKAAPWRSEVSLLNLKQSEMIININS